MLLLIVALPAPQRKDDRRLKGSGPLKEKWLLVPAEDLFWLCYTHSSQELLQERPRFTVVL